jgi:hypothetical protein
MDRIQINHNGGFFFNGKAFDEAKYLEIISVYKDQVRINGSCSIRQLAKEANISRNTAKKAVAFLEDGVITMKPSGRPKAGIGSNHGLTDEDHMFIYELYLDNPSRPLEDYCVKFWQQTGKVVSNSFISRWVYAYILCCCALYDIYTYVFIQVVSYHRTIQRKNEIDFHVSTEEVYR